VYVYDFLYHNFTLRYHSLIFWGIESSTTKGTREFMLNTGGKQTYISANPCSSMNHEKLHEQCHNQIMHLHLQWCLLKAPFFDILGH
jgi:hypothetical protein